MGGGRGYRKHTGEGWLRGPVLGHRKNDELGVDWCGIVERSHKVGSFICVYVVGQSYSYQYEAELFAALYGRTRTGTSHNGY